MGTLLVSDVIARAQDVLLDSGAVRWPSAELIRWLNDGLREIATLQPSANAKLANVTIIAGTKQSLPAGGIKLLRVVRNMGVGGATPGEVPRQVLGSTMDLHRPTWHADTPTLVVKNWMVDERTPRQFYVWPPSSGANNVECEYSAVPAAVVNTGDAITLDDFYFNALVDYVLYRSFQKEFEVQGYSQGSPSPKAKQHYDAFQAALAGADAGEKTQ